jgi:tetratricopeptide (TPR) repeat protein
MASPVLHRIAPVLALSVLAGAARAQQAAPRPAECRNLSYRSNFRLNGASQYIEAAGTTRFEDDRQQRINNALAQLTLAAQAGGVDPVSLWYLFGQAYLLKHDLRGADSAFAKAEAVTDPECKLDMQRRRRNEWVPLQNAGVEQMNAGNVDSALTLFRRGNFIYRSAPYAYLNMATIFVNRSELGLDSASVADEAHRRGVPDSVVKRERLTASDSAIVYYRAAARSSNDSRTEEARATALFNAARLLHRAAQDSAGIHAEAQRRGVSDTTVKNERLRTALDSYREVLGMRPRDLPAQASMAGVLAALHRREEARAVYDSMLAHSDSMSSFDLFDAGVALFRQERLDLAARAIELGLVKNRCHRDALFNLANTWLAARDSVHLLDAARRLVAVDSMNQASLRLLAAALQRNGDQQGTLRALLKTDSLPWEFTVIRFEPGDSTATLHGVVSNLQARTLPGFKLAVEFVNGACEDVATQQVDLPDLNANTSAGASYDFNLTVTGRGIVAWKYKTH